jgi:C-5 cytosine-specific DNA methylase
VSKPLAIDLFCGLGGWTDGLLAEGYDVVGFDIERHVYGGHFYPGQLVIQDVLTLHGSQFRDAALIVASPPCQEFSWMAMPWSRAKAKAAAIRADTSGKMLADLTRLFDVCFRIQAQASLAAGRHIPMVVENVRGAQPWVGLARFNVGSFHFWGDVPALMPVGRPKKQAGDSSWFYSNYENSARRFSSKSKERRQWSAEIAKIPPQLGRHIARTFRP